MPTRPLCTPTGRGWGPELSEGGNADPPRGYNLLQHASLDLESSPESQKATMCHNVAKPDPVLNAVQTFPLTLTMFPCSRSPAQGRRHLLSESRHLDLGLRGSRTRGTPCSAEGSLCVTCCPGDVAQAGSEIWVLACPALQAGLQAPLSLQAALG